jgi:tetratricopeptide (TPR) repeat protein
LALVLLAVVPYAGSIRNPLLYDDRTLLDNRWLLEEAGPASVFRHDYWHGTRHEGSDLYRPLTVLSLAWNMRVSPTKEGVRAVNVATHAAAVLALLWMLGAMVSPSAAWIGAALFAVHPLASEAVLWAVGRAEIVAAILGILAFALFVRLERERGPGGYRLALSLAAFFAALCFKESAAAWLVLGAAWVALRPRREKLEAKIVALRAASYVGVFVTYLGLRASAIGWGRHAPPFVDNPLVDADVATRVANAILLLGRYLAKMLWPRTLSVEYGFDQIPVVPLLPWGAIGAIALAAAWVGAIVALRRKGHASASYLAAFVPCAFAVTGNVVVPIGTVFAERLAYLPLAGLCGLVGLTVAAIPRPAWRAGAVALLLIACGARTVVRGGDYRDLATLSEATAAASPRAVKALANAGRVRLRQSRASDAVPLLEKAVAIRPDYARAWRLLADAYAASGDRARAEDAMRRGREAAARAGSDDEPL